MLAVRINGVDQVQAVSAVKLPIGLAVPSSAWASWQLKEPEGTPLQIEGGVYHLLQAALGLQWRIDEASQTLVIEAPPSVFSGTRHAVGAAGMPSVAAQSFGGFMNYDAQVQGTRFAGGEQRTAHAVVEMGAFADAGNGSSTGLVRRDASGTRWLRLDTGLNFDFPDRMTSVRVGDAVSQSGAWGRSLRHAGLQWGTNFATRPGFLSFPLPTLRGEAALPSTLELFINHTQRFRSSLPPGPFELSELPIVTGQGQIRMVVRDILGREQVVVQPYYVSPALLRPGLRAYGLDVGSVRENYGITSNDYGALMASAFDRKGVSETFTREWRAEAMRDQQALGAAGTWLLRSMGTANLAVAAGQDSRGSGGMFSAGADHQAARWSGSAQLRMAQRGFVQQGQPSGTTPRLVVAAALGTTWAGASVGTSYLQQDAWSGTRMRIATVSYGRELGRLGYLGLFALRDLGERGGSSLALTLTCALDPYTSSSLSITRNRDAAGAAHSGSLQVQRNIPSGPGFGYQISADAGTSERYQATGTWQTEAVTLQAGAAHTPTTEDYRVGASGAMAWIGNSVLMSRRIDGSFAVVQVSDYEHVRVLKDNQPVATTDAQGRAIITGLRGYQRNRISVDVADLPFDAEVDALEVMLTPRPRSGMTVNFPVQRARAATFRLLQANGSAVPTGSFLHVEGRPQRRFPIGFDGKAFASGLERRSTVVAQWPDHECRALVELESDEEVPELGPLTCK